MMTKAQEMLKADIEKVHIFIMGILAQQKLEQPHKPPEQTA